MDCNANNHKDGDYLPQTEILEPGWGIIIRAINLILGKYFYISFGIIVELQSIGPKGVFWFL